MAYLLDTNVLLRLVERTHPLHPTVRNALRTLRASGEDLVFTLQNLAEFWCAATRPAVARGGLGLTPDQAEREARRLERLFKLLPDDPAVYAEWRALLVSARVSGAHVHDARLVAAMKISGIANILTFNTADFGFPGITAVDPADVRWPTIPNPEPPCQPHAKPAACWCWG